MENRRLSNEEIDKRLIRLRNIERLRKNDKEKIARLEKEKFELKEIVANQQKTIETLLLRIEELEKIIFGGRGGDKKNGGISKHSKAKKKKKHKKRKAHTYRRSIPNQVDKEDFFDIGACPHCDTDLQKKEMVEQYIEDIVLPAVEEIKTKEIRKEIVEKGWCGRCGKWRSAKKIQPQQVMLGKNVKTLILFGTYVLNLSFSQISGMLLAMYSFRISDGEISNILERSSKKLLPEYQEIGGRIRGQPGNHYDETSWREFEEKCYAWVQTGTESEEAMFSVGRTRGKGVAERLKSNSQAIGISDCYAAYKNLFENHQVCWAHLQRNARDLANSSTLSEKKRKSCKDFYGEIAGIYAELIKFSKDEFCRKKGKKLKKQFLGIINRISVKNPNDPKKLADLRKRLEIYKDALFTCLEVSGIPADNNKAERKIRHIVLKRKNSFGTKSPKGSHTFSINASVVLSMWWTSSQSILPKLQKLLTS